VEAAEAVLVVLVMGQQAEAVLEDIENLFQIQPQVVYLFQFKLIL
jgi:hypothetical protein